MFSWLLLILAALLETGWAVGLKTSTGFTRFLPSLLTVACMVASFLLLALALRHIPLGTAYAVWTGIGTVGTIVVGMLLFGESAGAVQLLCMGLILTGVATA